MYDDEVNGKACYERSVAIDRIKLMKDNDNDNDQNLVSPQSVNLSNVSNEKVKSNNGSLLDDLHDLSEEQEDDELLNRLTIRLYQELTETSFQDILIQDKSLMQQFVNHLCVYLSTIYEADASVLDVPSQWSGFAEQSGNSSMSSLTQWKKHKGSKILAYLHRVLMSIVLLLRIHIFDLRESILSIGENSLFQVNTISQIIVKKQLVGHQDKQKTFNKLLDELVSCCL